MQQSKIQHADPTHELVSALADGELQGEELVRALAVLQSSAEAQACWHSYHLVGDVMRAGGGAALGAHDPAFMARLHERLLAEVGGPQTEVRLAQMLPRDSANDSVWRWKLVAGLSSLSVAALLAWQLALPSPQAVQLATPGPLPLAPQVSIAHSSGEAPVMIRDPRLDQLIAAHQQFGGTSALQMPAGFLRNATYERPAR